jgi:hypothetical protein
VEVEAVGGGDGRAEGAREVAIGGEVGGVVPVGVGGGGRLKVGRLKAGRLKS